MRKTTLLLLVPLALGLASCGGSETSGGEAVTVEMKAEHGSSQSGTATLTPDDGTTEVEIVLDQGTAEPQPAHIHEGTCADLDPQPKYPLDGVVDGESRTTVPVPLSELTRDRLAINVHKSEGEPQTYVSCGDIGRADAEQTG